MSILREFNVRTSIVGNVMRVYMYALMRGSARARQSNPTRILVLQSAKLGDMVCTTPVFRAIKQRYPDAELIVAGDALNRSLLSGDQYIHEYFVITKDLASLTEMIARRHIDVALIINPSFANTAACFLGNVRTIIVPKICGGYNPFETTSFKLIRPLMLTYAWAFGEYAPRAFLNALIHIDIIATDTRKELPVTAAAGAKIRAYLDTHVGDAFLVGVSASSGNKIKKWPEERFAALIDHIVAKHNAKVILIGSKSDAEQVHKTFSLVTHTENVLNTCEQFSLEELKALIAEMDMFVSVDTGPIYIAEAFGVPTIDIVGPMDDREQPPVGELHRVVIPPRDAPAIHLLNARPADVSEATAQIESTSVPMVIDVFEDLLAQIRA